MRLFIAVELDAAAKSAISAEQKRIASPMRDGRSSLKWIKPDQMHLTLVFLGEVAEDRAPALIDAVSRPVDTSAFDLTFSGLGLFPPHGAPRVLWIGVTDGARELCDLQREMSRRAESCGVALESRPFHPHLTLGRWRDSRPSDRRVAMAAAAASIPVAHVHVDGATLFHSRLGPAGPTHTPLARARLSE